MRQDVLDFLKAVVEGHPQGNAWHIWLEANDKYLQESLSRGSFLRLKFHPLNEAKLILQRAHISFKPSNAFEWLDTDSRSGKCRYCGAQIERGLLGSAWCPDGCFLLMT